MVAIVTGGSRGIGRATALRLAAEGADVALVAREGERLGRSLGSTADDVRATGRRAIEIVADLSDPDVRRAEVVERTDAELGPVDILVNNAAMSVFKNVADWSIERLRTMQEINVWAPWELIQAALPGMLERDRGWIVNISSGVAEPTHARSGGAAYGGTKAMLDQMTRCLALELEGTRVVANVVSPQAAARTEFVDSLVAKSVLSEALTEPVEAMAEAVLALATAPRDVRGLVVRDLDLLLQLGRPVREVNGGLVIDGYDVDDLATRVRELAEEADKPRDLRGAWGASWGKRS